MTKISALLIGQAKRRIPLIAKVFGFNLLDKESTLSRLKNNTLLFLPGELINIPPIVSHGGNIEEFKTEEIVESSSVAVFCVNNREKIDILPYGGIKLNDDILDLDFGSSEFIKTLFMSDKRQTVCTKNCIVLWSHNWGGGYYDYLIFIYAKLLRIKAEMSETEFKESKIVYPVFGKSFENELCRLVGVKEDQILDVRKFNVMADKYFCGSNQNWFYPNPYDVFNLSKTVYHLNIDENLDNDKIYISRGGRRKLINEIEVTKALKEFGFKIIADSPRSILEQMTIYRNAKIIIGPHGASFTNIIWCKPGTKLIELFSNNYYPPYFQYLAKVLNLEYHAIFENNVTGSHYSNLDNDIKIDPEVIKTSLKKIMKQN